MPSDRAEDVAGDLAEEHTVRRSQSGRLAAHLWYWKQVAHFLIRVSTDRLTRGPAPTPLPADPPPKGRDVMLQDIRYALRVLGKSPGFVAAAVLTLRLGIGANTVIFSVVDAVLLKPLSYKDPGQLVVIREIIPQIADVYPTLPVNAHHFVTWQQQSQSFEGMAAIGTQDFNLTGDGEPERLHAARVSYSLFPTLGVGAALGRTFLAEEGQPGNDQVVVLTDRFWRRRFEADPSIVGRAVTLDGARYEIVGVLAAEFHFPKSAEFGPMTELGVEIDLFKPLAWDPSELRPAGSHNFAVVARLRKDVSAEQAVSELNMLEAAISDELPIDMDLLAVVVPLQEQVVREVRLTLLVLLAAVAAVLMIVCVNIANLMLARSAKRQRDAAIRVALGAGSRRLIGQMLWESLILAVVGGLAGILLANLALGLLATVPPAAFPRFG